MCIYFVSLTLINTTKIYSYKIKNQSKNQEILKIATNSFMR
ncbi:hypothetical protein CCS77_0338 [Campylobacter concisus]|uniref:Uncharacterized protein n=1 Tax=Campylobacter concisus TaxID=199 RepID=A0A2R4NY92_9BACT|nr:hypothetical protein CCS77_0338 [Campylobacter concisus]